MTLHDQVFGDATQDAAAQQAAAQQAAQQAARPDPFDKLIVDLIRHVAMNPQVIPQYLRAWSAIQSFAGTGNGQPTQSAPPRQPPAGNGTPTPDATPAESPDAGGLEDALGGDTGMAGMGGLMDMMDGEMGPTPETYQATADRVRDLTDDELRNVLLRVVGDLDIDPRMAADLIEQVGQVAPMLEPVAGVSVDPYLDTLTGYLPDHDGQQDPDPDDAHS